MLNLELAPVEVQNILNFMKSALAAVTVNDPQFDEIVDAYVHHRDKIRNAKPAVVAPPVPPAPIKPAKTAK